MKGEGTPRKNYQPSLIRVKVGKSYKKLREIYVKCLKRTLERLILLEYCKNRVTFYLNKWDFFTSCRQMFGDEILKILQIVSKNWDLQTQYSSFKNKVTIYLNFW